jgi:hypothetical protein
VYGAEESGCASLFAFCVEPGPEDEGELEGKPEPGGPERDGWEAVVLCDHGDVCGEDGDQEGDEAPGCGAAGLGDKDAEAAEDLGGTTDEDEFTVRGQKGRDDAGVGAGGEEVKGASTDVEGAHDEAAYAHSGHLRGGRADLLEGLER